MRARIFLMAVTLALGVAACAPARAPALGSVVPGTIGVAVRPAADAVVVSAVGKGSPAERAGVRVGDRIVRYNGETIQDVRQFERLVLDSVPGRLARLDISRAGESRTLEIPVEQARVAVRV